MKDLLFIDKNTLKTVINAVQEFSLWVTLAIVATLLVAYVVIRIKKQDLLPRFGNLVIGIVIGYSATLISIVLFLQITRMKVKGELDVNFFLFVGFFVMLILLAILNFVIRKDNPRARKILSWITFALVIVYAVCLYLLLPSADSDYKPTNTVTYYLLTALLVAAIIVLAFIFDKHGSEASETKSLAYGGICVALSFALSFVKFFSLPLGGSVTLASMFPLMLYSYIFGAKKGIFLGVIYGVLQFIQNPQVYEPIQVLIDYPVAFSAIGLAGIAKSFKFLKGNALAEICVGMTIAAIFRFTAHVLSGYYVFYTWSTMENVLVYSIVYNSFIFVDLIIDVVVGVMIFSSKNLRNQITFLARQ